MGYFILSSWENQHFFIDIRFFSLNVQSTTFIIMYI